MKCRLVVAGGVSTLEEVVALEKLGCDVQLGMALYTGKVALKDGFIDCLDWDKVELITVVAQSVTGEVLMVGYANREAFEKTFDTGKLTFWSRSRNTLWTKGETSGNTLDVVRLRVDCDRDTVLATVRPAGPACHTGAWTCFKTVSDRPYRSRLPSIGNRRPLRESQARLVYGDAHSRTRPRKKSRKRPRSSSRPTGRTRSCGKPQIFCIS